MVEWNFEKTRKGYGNLWRKAQIKPGKDAINAERFATLITANESRYRAVSAKCGGVPWYFIGALHMRESSCNFSGILHNGEKIIGTGRKTKLVPANRGPFSSWEESAIDALKLKGLHLIKDWSAARMGYEAENFNGRGYIGKGVNSAYLWAGSTNEQIGKYVADRVWDANYDDPQIGVMTVLKRLCAKRPDIDAELNGPAVIPPPPDIPKPDPKSDEQPITRRTILRRLWGWITGGGLAAGGVFAGFSDWQIAAVVIGAFAIVGLVIFLVVWFTVGKK